MGQKLLEVGIGNDFLVMTPKAQTTKVKLDHGITLNLKKHNDLRDQNHNITSHYQMYCVAIIKKQKCKVCGEDVEKTESLYIVGGNINWYSHYENTLEVS